LESFELYRSQNQLLEVSYMPDPAAFLFEADASQLLARFLRDENQLAG
jgi:hypothetical protein